MVGWLGLKTFIHMSFSIYHFHKIKFFKLIIMITNLSRLQMTFCLLLRMEKLLETNRQLIDSRLAVTDQLITFVKICGELNEHMNKLEMLIADEKQQLDKTVMENSRWGEIFLSYFYFFLFSISVGFLYNNFIYKFVILERI